MRKRKIALLLSAALVFTGAVPNAVIGFAEEGAVIDEEGYTQATEESQEVSETARENAVEISIDDADIIPLEGEENVESKEIVAENEEETVGAAGKEPESVTPGSLEEEDGNTGESDSADVGGESEVAIESDFVAEISVFSVESGSTDDVTGTPEDAANDGLSFDKAVELTESGAQANISAGQNYYFSFTPDKEGMYSFSSSGSYDTSATLYKKGSSESDSTSLISNDSGNMMGDGDNFRISYPLEASATYILKVSATADVGNLNVSVEQYDISTFCSGTVLPGSDSVGFYSFTPSETRYYSFTIDDEDGYLFLYEPNMEKKSIYQCVLYADTTYYAEIQNNGLNDVTVTYKTRNWTFANGEVVDGEHYTIGNPGDSLTIYAPEIEVIGDASSVSISYQWQATDYATSDYVDIPGETNKTYTTTRAGNYCCVVSDTEGNKAYYEAIVSVGTGLTVERTTPEKITAPIGTTTTLGVSASSNYGPITYQWCRYYNEGDVSYYGAIPGETSPTLTITVPDTTYVEYRCLVADKYSNDGIWFWSRPTACTHQWTTVIDKAPTCASAGSQHQECQICHTKQSATTIPATGNHSYGAYVQTTAPTALSAGVNTRTCSVCGAKDTASIPKLTPTISVNATKLTLKVKQSTTKLKVSGLAAGDYITSWKSSNTKIVTVNSKGKITAKNKTGKATITVTLASGLTKKISVTVQKNTVTTTKISGLAKKVSVAKGKKYTLKPTITPITSADKVTYKTSNKKVATVSAKGVITAKAAGTAKITVTSGKKKATVTVTVPKTKTTAITGVKSALTIKKGKTYKLKTKLTPKNSDQSVTYSTSNKKVATVDKNGKITAKKAGKATITVKSGSVKVKCVVTVK